MRGQSINVPTLKYRQIQGEKVEVFKITHYKCDTKVSPHLTFNSRANTRGNDYELLIGYED